MMEKSSVSNSISTVPISNALSSPIFISGKVVKGFQRGSAALGIPTANIDPQAFPIEIQKLEKGSIFFGWAQIQKPEEFPSQPAFSSTPNPLLKSTEEINTSHKSSLLELWTAKNFTVLPMVASIGINPFFHNEIKSKTVEIHILSKFPTTFYYFQLSALITGFLRFEKNFGSLEELKLAIQQDVKDATKLLVHNHHQQYKSFSKFSKL